MNKEELILKVYDFWNKYLTSEIDREELKSEIEHNILNNKIVQEIDYIRIELDDWEEKTQERNDLIEIYNDLQNYKTKIESKGV